jgi:hypothetical protein
MQLKKIAVCISLLTLTTAAHAGLQTVNYTHEDSSVHVTSGIIKPCSSSAGVYTPKMNSDGSPGVSSAKDTEITLLCKTSKNNTCTADIFNSNNCTGSKVGYASLNLITKSVTNVTSTNPKYVFTSENNGTKLTIRYAS